VRATGRAALVCLAVAAALLLSGLAGRGWQAALLPSLLLVGAIAGAAWEGWRPEPKQVRLKKGIQGAGEGAASAAVLLPLFLLGLWAWRRHVLDVPTALSWEAAGPRLALLGILAVCEEAFFRGYLQRALEEAWGRRWRLAGARFGPGLIAASVAFGVAHVPVYGAGGPLRAVPGLLLGLLYARRGSLAGPVVFHWAANALMLGVRPAAGLLP
jgi:hypothetical protein